MSEDSRQVGTDEFMKQNDTSDVSVNLHPHIRQLGIEVPDGWEVASLGEIGQLDTSSVDKKSDSDERRVSLVNYMDVYEKNRISSNIDYMRVTAPESHIERSQVRPGDILFTPSSEEPGDIGNSAVVTEDMERTLHSYHTVRLRPTSDIIQLDIGFSGWFANAPYVAKQFERRATGSTRYTLTLDDFSDTQVLVPPLSEQRKIASVLYTVDRAIEKTEEIIFQLGKTKKGLCQTLFLAGYKQHRQYRSTKYGKIPESWSFSKLTEVTSQIQAGGTPDTDVTEYYGGNIPWVKTGELSQYHVTETEQSITERGLEESAARLFSPKTILIAMYGATTGEVSLLEIEAATNQACCGVVTTDEVAPEFLFHQLNHLSHRLESLSAGSGQQNISKGIIEKFDIVVPPVEEQHSIVDVLSSVDESIIKNKSTRMEYRRLKRGLMQDLLSGTVRTADANIEVPEEVAQHG